MSTATTTTTTTTVEGKQPWNLVPVPWHAVAALLPRDREERLPCAGDPDYISQDDARRALAAMRCGPCPALFECRSTGREYKQPWVWEGWTWELRRTESRKPRSHSRWCRGVRGTGTGGCETASR